MTREAYAGIDGGGTRTRAVVCRADLVVVGRGDSGPASASAAPVPRVVESVTEAVDDALSAAGLARTDLAAVSCGLAGVEGSGARARLEAALAAAFPGSRILVFTDARIALAGASPHGALEPGIVLIAGTGAVAFGRNASGEEARASGWGSVIGDEGSAFVIARKALNAAARAFDGRGPATVLADLLFSSEGTGSPTELLQRLYRAGATPGNVAAYFPLVLEAARRGDALALSLLSEASEELALAALTVAARLELSSPVIATIGGVLTSSDLVLGPLRERVRAALPGARVGPPAYPPELGAVRLALAG